MPLRLANGPDASGAQARVDAAYRTKAGPLAAQDTFTSPDGTALAARSADSGQLWTVSGGSATIQGGRLVVAASGPTRAVLSGTLDGPDQDATLVGDVQASYFGVKLRAGANDSGYYIGWSDQRQPLVIAFDRDGTQRVAPLYVGNALTAGPHTIFGTVRNVRGVPSLSIYADGVLQGSVADTDARAMLDAGSVAILGLNQAGVGIDSVAVRTWPRDPMVLGAIGNSIVMGNGLAAGQDPLSRMGYWLGRFGGFAPTTVNRGIPATRVDVDWAPGSADLSSAKAAFAAAGVTDVMLMFGTNEAQAASTLTPAQYGAALAATCADLVAVGYRCHLCAAPALVPGTASAFDAASNGRIAAFAAQEDALVNGTTIRFGGRGAFALTGADPTLLQDGLHPTATGADAMGIDWAFGLLRSRGSELPGLA